MTAGPAGERYQLCSAGRPGHQLAVADVRLQGLLKIVITQEDERAADLSQ